MDVVAWIHPETLVSDEIVVVIDDSPDILDLNLGRIGGIEFSTIDDNILYVSCTDAGIVAIDYTNYNNTGEIIYLHSVAPDYNYGRTFLQTAPDGNIYGVSNDGTELGRIIQVGPDAGSFESEDVFTFPYGGIKTFKVFGETSYYILPENQRVHNFMTLSAITTPVCPDHTNGTATITVEGGFTDYTYQLYIYDGGWQPMGDPTTTPNTEHTFTDLAEGTYKCTVTDGYNNTEEIEFSITDDKFDVNELKDITSYDPDYWTDKNRTYKLGFKISGNTSITINNSTLQFGKYAKIVIEPGSELIVDGSTLTHYAECNDPWLGVEIWGNSDQSQYVGADGIMHQGKLVVINESEISNAWNAVTTQNPDDFHSHGGIIMAENSTFENNKRSVEILQYQNFHPDIPDIKLPYVHRFKKCTFVTDDNYLFPEELDKHVSIWDVYGIKFMGCKFKNNNTAAQHTGHGIYSFDAGYSLLNYCSSNSQPCPPDDIVYNEFHNLYKGVHATNGTTSRNTIYVNDANFINNSIGVYISNVHNAIVINSDFEIGYNHIDIPSCGFSNSFGIDIHIASGFAFEENNFTKYTGALPGYYTGIRVNDCPSVNDVIYKNYFDGLSYGNYAYGTNRENPDADDNGLKYECNTNANNAVDFIVTHEQEEDAMIHTHHGINDVQASGNTFSEIVFPELQWHFRNEGLQNINWYYCDDETTCPDQTPTKYMDNCEGLQVCFTPIDAPEYDCLSHYEKGDDIKLNATERQQVETDYANNLSDYDNVKALYDNLNDGGNTTGELLDIQTATPDDMWALRAQLLGDSPHLSKEVLMEAADKTDVLPESAIFDIMAANPDEMRNEEMISYLENKDEPLPDYMISLLRQLSNGSTYKTVLLHDMATYHAAKTKAAQDIIRSILYDTIVDHTDYRNWLDNMGNMEADKQIISSYLTEGDATNAIALLNMLPALYDLQDEALDAYNDYSYMINLHITLQSQNRDIFQLDSIEMADLLWMADSATLAAREQSRNILEFAYDYDYCNCLYVSDTTVVKSSGINNYNISKAMGISITVKPNPASNWAQFSYQLPYSAVTGEIIITDITGKFIDRLNVTGVKGMKLWDTRNVPKGVYLYTLRANDFSSTGKIVIGR